MIWYLDSTPLQKNQDCAVPLGVQGENEAKVYSADVSDWLTAYPLGVIVLVLQAPDGSAPYMADTQTDTDTGKVLWTVTNFDTAIVGYGKGELRLVSSGAVIKSYTFRTYTKPSILMCASTPPAPVPEWATEILDAASGLNVAIEAAETATQKAQEATEAASDASDSARAAQEYAALADGYADDAQESKDMAQIYAQLAEMSAETHGFCRFYIDDNGHLIYEATESLDDVDFELTNGRLIVSYGS